LSKSYPGRETVIDDFVPLTYDGQGGKTVTTTTFVPLVSGMEGEKQKERKRKTTEGIQIGFDKSRQ
jgi:hypothetical protein